MPVVVPERISFLVTGDEDQRKETWNGESMRTGGRGVSGSESAFVSFAEHWAGLGHNATIFASFCRESYFKGVHYVADMNKAIEDATILVILPWFRHLDELSINSNVSSSPSSLSSIPALKYLIIDYQGVGIPPNLENFMKKHTSVKVVSMFPSEWTRRAVYSNARKHNVNLFVLSGKSFIINNPLLSDVVAAVDANVTGTSLTNNNGSSRNGRGWREPRSFVWAAAFERGGSIALKVFHLINGSHFKIMTYLNIAQRSENNAMVYIDPELGHLQRRWRNGDKRVSLTIGMDKQGVLKEMAQASYFLYPLTLSSTSNYPGSVHKDTFALCVAEALAMGAIVITWPVAALPELYPESESGVVYLSFPSLANEPALKGYDYVQDPALVSTDAIGLMVNKIQELESKGIAYLDSLRAKGMIFSRTKYSMDAIGRQLDAMSSELEFRI